MLWYALALTRLNFENYKLSSISKFFRIFFLVTFAIALFYFTAFILCFPENNSLKKSVVHFLLSVNAGMMWCIVYSKKKDISYAVLEVHRQWKYCRFFKKRMHFSIISLTFFILFFSCLSYISHCSLKFRMNFFSVGFFLLWCWVTK